MTKEIIKSKPFVEFFRSRKRKTVFASNDFKLVTVCKVFFQKRLKDLNKSILLYKNSTNPCHTIEFPLLKEIMLRFRTTYKDKFCLDKSD